MTKILIAPIEIAGQYRNLALAIRSLGHGCEYYTFYSHPFAYGGDIGSNPLPRTLRHISSMREGRIRIYQHFLTISFELIRLLFFLWAIFRYDAFIFGFGITLLRGNCDLYILKLLGKKTIVNMSHGSDMTPDYIDGALLNLEGQMPAAAELSNSCIKKLKRVRRIENNAAIIIGSPLSSSYFASKPFVSIFSIGRVCQSHYSSYSSPTASITERHQAIKILHVPSHAPGKGSALIEATIGELIDAGYMIDFIKLSGVPNDIVLRHIRECDLVVDQLYSDLPMSGIACEAAFFAKPTLLAGYELESLCSIVPTSDLPPTIICHPDQFVSTLEHLIKNPYLLKQHACAAFEFVNSRWNPHQVASRYMQLITHSEIPIHWWHNPKILTNVHGYGLSEAKLKENILSLVDCCGPNSLCLSHRPDLLDAMISFARR